VSGRFFSTDQRGFSGSSTTGPEQFKGKYVYDLISAEWIVFLHLLKIVNKTVEKQEIKGQNSFRY